jgi:hypothetical protein
VWYQGFDVRADAPAGTQLVLDPDLVRKRRALLAATDPWEHLQDRRLEFAHLAGPELDQELDLPPAFVAVDGGAPLDEPPFEVVALEALSGAEARTAAVARSRGFLGGYGPYAYVALFAGLPAVVFGAGPADEADLALAGRLAHAPFGRLHVLEASAPGAAARAVSLLAQAESPVAAA